METSRSPSRLAGVAIAFTWRDKMSRFVLPLIALFFLFDAAQPARALTIPAIIATLPSLDASGAFILVRKGKGHGDGDERYEGRRYHAHGFARYRKHSRGFRAFNGNQGHSSRSGGGNQNQPDGQN
jgi:hypothetical protein